MYKRHGILGKLWIICSFLNIVSLNPEEVRVKTIGGINGTHQRIWLYFRQDISYRISASEWLDLEVVEKNDRCAGVEQWGAWGSAGKLLGWSEGYVLDTTEQRLLIAHPWAT